MGRIYPPFVFGVIMLIRFILLYLISFSVFADCPAGESIGSYPSSTPTSFCADYIGSNCLAVCGWSSESSAAVCVGIGDNLGPYRLTGASCTPSDSGGSGTVDCAVNPIDESCWPDPSTPLTPDSPECDYLPVSLYPGCQDTSSGGTADGVGSYQDSNGTWRELRINTGLKDTITTSAKGVQDEVSKLSQKFANEISTSNDLLSVINNNLLSSKDVSVNSSNSIVDHLGNIENILSNPVSGSTGSNSSGSTPIDYSGRLDAIINGLYSMQPFLSSRFSGLESALLPLNNIYNVSSDQRSLQRAISQNLISVDSKLSSVISGLSGLGGSGSGGGSGDGTGSSVGTFENPAYVAPSFYEPCSNCLIDVAGAQSELDVSKEKLKALNKTILADFKNIFTFDSGAGSGSSVISSCWDFGDLIGLKCMQLDETWGLLKALVLFIFMIAIVFMFTRGD